MNKNVTIKKPIAMKEKTYLWSNINFIAGLVAFLSFFLVWIYMHYGLNYDPFRSDVEWYWSSSLEWKKALFCKYHFPGYPFLIAFIRFLTVNQLPPLVIMWSINLFSLIAGAWAVSACIGSFAGRRAAIFCGILYPLWPFVGTAYAVHPLCDNLAMSLFLIGIYFLIKKNFYFVAFFLGFSMFTHKGICPFVGLLFVFTMLLYYKELKWLQVVTLSSMYIPIVSLWIAGSVYYSSPLWLFSTSFSIGVIANNTLPLLDGMIAAPFVDGITGAFKGSLIWIIVLTSFVLAVINRKNRNVLLKWYNLAIIIAVLFWCFTANRNANWVAFRFSRLLVLPIGWLLGYYIELFTRGSWRLVFSLIVIFVLFISQFFFIWYMAKIYFV